MGQSGETQLGLRARWEEKPTNNVIQNQATFPLPRKRENMFLSFTPTLAICTIVHE